MSISKISVDLRQRTFSIEVPDERVEAVLERVEALFKNEPASPPDLVSTSQEETSLADRDPPVAPNEEAPKSTVENTVKKRGKGTAKVKSWDLIDLPLTAEQRQEIREFFQSKAPQKQNDAVAVLGVKLKKYLNKSNFSGDEIHSAFKIVNLPTPRNLNAVFGNMKRDGKGGYSNNQFIVNSHTEDYVEYHMTVAQKEPSK